jgi:putative endonuclease
MSVRLHRVHLHHGQQLSPFVHPNCHTAKYNIHDLVYFERFSSILAAIRREKVLKGWLRVRKLELIIATNPEWKAVLEKLRNKSK